MILALFEKEIRQHGAMLFLLLLLTYSGMFVMQSNELLSLSGGSVFYLVAWMLMVILPLGCLVLGNALIATEFRQKTQVFLDGLPLPRWKLVAVKYLFGLAATEFISALLLGTMLFNAWQSEWINLRFAVLLAIKTGCWSWFCWATIFAMSFLGRYRMMIGLTVVLGLMWAQQVGGVLVNRFGPFELISERFAHERVEYPSMELWSTGGLIVALTVLGFSLALIRDATLATMLSERMSSREKLVIFSIGIAGLMIMGAVADRAEKVDPLDMPDSVDIVDGIVNVSAAAAVAEPTEEERKAMQLHAESAVRAIREIAAYLNIKKFPPLFLLHRRDLDKEEFQDGELDSRQGYLLRLNMLNTQPSSPLLQSQFIEKLLDAKQHYRLNSDSRGWILKGFAQWWPRHSQSEHNEPSEQSSVTSASLAIGNADRFRETTIVAENLVQWKRFRKQLETTSDEGLIASVGIETIWRQDQAACREFLTAALGYAAPYDFRASVHDWWYSTAVLVRTTLHMNLDELASKWTALLRSETLSEWESHPQ